MGSLSHLKILNLLIGGLEHEFVFPYIGNVIIPSDELHHFSEGYRYTTNQSLLLTIINHIITMVLTMINSILTNLYKKYDKLCYTVDGPCSSTMYLLKRVDKNWSR